MHGFSSQDPWVRSLWPSDVFSSLTVKSPCSELRFPIIIFNLADYAKKNIYITSGKLVPLDIPLRFRNRYVSIKKRSGKGHRKVVCAPGRPSVCCWGSRPWMNALELFLSFNTSDTTSWIKFHLLYDLWCNRFDVGADEIYILFLVWHSRPVSLISKEELVNRARNRLKYHSTQVATNYRFNFEFANRIEGGGGALCPN